MKTGTWTGLKRRRMSLGRIMEKIWETLMVYKNSNEVKGISTEKNVLKQKWSFSGTVPDHDNLN